MAISAKKQKPFRIIIFAIFVFLFSLALLVYNSVREVQDEIWQSYGSPYDVKSEYLNNNLLSKIRKDISNNFLGGVLGPFLESMHERVYISAKSKMPSDDPAWIEYWYDQKFNTPNPPKHFNNPEKVVAEVQAAIVELANNDSKIKEYQFSRRYYLAGMLGSYFLQNLYASNEATDKKVKRAEEVLASISIVIVQMDQMRSVDKAPSFVADYTDLIRIKLKTLLFLLSSQSPINCSSDVILETESLLRSLNSGSNNSFWQFDYVEASKLQEINKILNKNAAEAKALLRQHCNKII